MTTMSAYLSSLVSLFSLGAGLEAVLALDITVAGRASVRITSPEDPRSVVTLLLLIFACWSLARCSLKTEKHTHVLPKFNSLYFFKIKVLRFTQQWIRRIVSYGI
jgi:hypothetical protein